MRHRHRFVVLAAVAASAALAACSSKDATTAPVSHDVTGEWSGTTSQDKNMLFTVTAAGVSHATFTYVLQGSRCFYTSTLQVPTTTAMTIASNRFILDRTQVGSALFISGSGTFSSSTAATGTFVVQDGQCGDTLSLTWSAAKQ
jgi:hypothetical protein